GDLSIVLLLVKIFSLWQLCSPFFIFISLVPGFVEGDELLLGQTTLMFTTEDFEDRESALSRYKKVGERARQSRLE
ncbi:MAG: hypothetical protein P8Z79_23060, partial [Sedimentisphaerales bacterium]